VAPVVPLLLAVAFVAAVLPARAQDAAVTEESVKAAFLYKFPSFVEWPDNRLAREDEPVVIGVIGGPEVLAELGAIAQSRKTGRPLIALAVRDSAPLPRVHVLFIGSREKARAPELIRAAQQAGALVVTEWDGALRVGSIINFVTTPEGRVRFDIAVEPAEKSRLRLSSRLLAVAQHVHNPRP
jgi:hypothetical protein